MKKIVSIMAAGVLLAGITSLFAADSAGKQVTISGTAMCAKCALHESAHCQTVIQSKENGKTVTYWLTPNKTATAFHNNVCTSGEKVTATGTLSVKGGKEMLAVTKIGPGK